MAAVGTGKYTYELVENWAKLPAGWVLGQTAIVTDSQDRVYLFNRSDHPLIVLDREGNFLSSWGEGTLPDAHGMFIDGEDNLYMPVKNSHVVLKYNSQGNLLMTLGAWDQPSDTGWSGNYSDPAQRAAGPFNRPSDVALDPNGDLYISECLALFRPVTQAESQDQTAFADVVQGRHLLRHINRVEQG